MKKKYLLVIFIVIIFIVLIKIVIDLNSPASSVKIAAGKIDELQKIHFQIAEYESVDDIVFYNKNYNIPDEDKENFKEIASTLKKTCPGKQIVYEYKMGENLYRCRQYIDGYIIDDTWMNVSASGGISFTVNSYWKSNIEIEKPKITYNEAEAITKKYLSEHKSEFYEITDGVVNNEAYCTIELYYYKGKTVLNIHFSVGDSSLKIDANSGKIVDKYFFSGKMID